MCPWSNYALERSVTRFERARRRRADHYRAYGAPTGLRRGPLNADVRHPDGNCTNQDVWKHVGQLKDQCLDVECVVCNYFYPTGAFL